MWKVREKKELAGLTCQSTDTDFLIARMTVQGYSLQSLKSGEWCTDNTHAHSCSSTVMGEGTGFTHTQHCTQPPGGH